MQTAFNIACWAAGLLALVAFCRFTERYGREDENMENENVPLDSLNLGERYEFYLRPSGICVAGVYAGMYAQGRGRGAWWKCKSRPGIAAGCTLTRSRGSTPPNAPEFERMKPVKVPLDVLRAAAAAVEGGGQYFLVEDVDWDLKQPCNDCPFLRTSPYHDGVAENLPSCLESIRGETLRTQLPQDGQPADVRRSAFVERPAEALRGRDPDAAENRQW